MVELSLPFRRATPDDAQVLADAINMAGEGMPIYLWSKMARPGGDPWAVGRERARREEGSFSYRNAVIYEVGGEPAACLLGYREPDEPRPIDYDKMPPMFVGLQELENLAPGNWYVNVLATYQEHRGKGYGTELLALAERIAADVDAKGMSIIVADTNHGARRLYERSGYRAIATRPVVKEDWDGAAENWVLLTKGL